MAGARLLTARVGKLTSARLVKARFKKPQTNCFEILFHFPVTPNSWKRNCKIKHCQDTIYQMK